MRYVLSFLLAVGIAPAADAVTTLDFAGSICGGEACFNGSRIDQTYGDVGGQVDVVYDADRATPGVEELFHWGTGYETLTNVAYGRTTGGLSILFDALTGYEVTVFGFDIAPFSNRSRSTSVQVIDTADPSPLVDQNFEPLTTAEVTSIMGTWTSASGILINLGPDAFDVGISNIRYEVTAISPSAAVPLPAAGWMLLAGLGGFGLLRRHARR